VLIGRIWRWDCPQAVLCFDFHSTSSQATMAMLQSCTQVAKGRITAAIPPLQVGPVWLVNQVLRCRGSQLPASQASIPGSRRMVTTICKSTWNPVSIFEQDLPLNYSKDASVLFLFNHLTVLIVVSFNHDTTLTFFKEEGFLSVIRIFAECLCEQFPDRPRYYVNYD
jgi:hypothetical protein